MSDYKERLVEEQLELTGKIDKLQTFVGTDGFAALDDLNRSMLLSQLVIMFSYQSILEMRIMGVPEKVVL